MACFCLLLHFLGPIWLFHLLRICGHKLLTHGLMKHRCQKILLFYLSPMVWTFLCDLSQIPRSCQTGRRILEYQTTWYDLGWWFSGPSTSQRIRPHSKWRFTQCHNHVTVLLQLYPRLHWLLIHINCEIFSHNIVGLSFITSSISFQHNSFLPWYQYCTSQ